MKTLRSWQLAGSILMLGVLTACSKDDVEGQEDQAITTEWDRFDGSSLSIGATDSKWFYTAYATYLANDGNVTTGSGGLTVKSKPSPTTGQPAFANTLPQNSDFNPPNLPGPLEHVKWAAYMQNQASSGQIGFDANIGEIISCETTLSGQTFGTANHPFGNAVLDPDDDLRLASPAMLTIDFESGLVFDFFLTNKTIYAIYERTALLRPLDKNWAPFFYAIPLANRRPDTKHNLKIAYDRANHTVRYYMEGEEVFKVTKIGKRIDRQWMLVDNGGLDEVVDMRQWTCGMGLFTILDGYDHYTKKSLAALTSYPGFYRNPETGGFEGLTFADPASKDASRLFGQGAEMTLGTYNVVRTPIKK